MTPVTIGDAVLYLGDCLDIACKRIAREYAQLKLFPPEEKHKAHQEELAL